MRKDIVLESESAVPLCGPRLRDSPRLAELSEERLCGRREEDVRKEAAAMLAEMFKRQSERWGWDTTDAARAARDAKELRLYGYAQPKEED